MSKFKRIFYRLTQPKSIFYMARIAANPRIEDMRQAMLSKKDITHYSCTFCITIIAPYSSQIGYSVDMLFLQEHISKKLLCGYSMSHAYVCNQVSIFLHKTDYRFSKIFWDVFGLVFYFWERVLGFFCYGRDLDTIVVLGNSSLICDDP